MIGDKLEGFLVSTRDHPVVELLSRAGTPLERVLGLSISVSLRARARRSRRLPRPVISVGNITVGGTGKTTFIGLLLSIMEERDLKTAVLYRGYKREERGLVAIGNGTKPCDYRRSGDEPCMVARWSKRAKVFVHRERYRAGTAAMEEYSPDIFLLDDGFQHVSLRRDLDIVLVDSTNPFDNGRLFPFGLLREPISSLKRAHLIVLTRCNQSDFDPAVEAIVNEVAPGVPVARAVHVADSLLSIEDETSPSTALRAKRVLLFSGIGNNSSFLLSAMESGAEVLGIQTFTDHHAYSPDDIARMERRARALGADCLLTTEKDMVRIPRANFSVPAYALTVKMVLVSGREHLESKLTRLLDRVD